VSWTTRFKQRRRRLPRDPLPEHETVLEGIRSGCPVQAREAMETLLELALRDMGLPGDPAGKATIKDPPRPR
jgi:DNA-binding FadR family transcriptional regulator